MGKGRSQGSGGRKKVCRRRNFFDRQLSGHDIIPDFLFPVPYSLLPTPYSLFSIPYCLFKKDKGLLLFSAKPKMPRSQYLYSKFPWLSNRKVAPLWVK